mgnify:CR=1 FL=1
MHSAVHSASSEHSPSPESSLASAPEGKHSSSLALASSHTFAQPSMPVSQSAGARRAALQLLHPELKLLDLPGELATHLPGLDPAAIIGQLRQARPDASASDLFFAVTAERFFRQSSTIQAAAYGAGPAASRCTAGARTPSRASR